MYCPNCGMAAQSNSQFCGNCGAVLNLTASAAHSNSNEQIEKVKSFLKQNLIQLTKSIFSQPIKGAQEVFINAGNESYFYSIVIYSVTVLLYIFLPYLFVGDMRSYLGFSNFLKIGIAVFIMLFIISILTFVIKSTSSKPDFKKELLTGALCGIPMMVLIILISIFSLFNNNISMWSIVQYPQSAINSGIFMLIVIIYILLMLINIVQQSLKAAGCTDAVSWYLSPAVITLSFYLGGKISYQILFQ